MSEQYVLGFLFDATRESVLLMLKQRPEWQHGLWNGVGGKIEGDETPEVAMRREFAEEAGLNVAWTAFGLMIGVGWTVHLFASYTRWEQPRQMEAEEIAWYPVNRLPSCAIDNIPFLVAAASLALGDGNKFTLSVEYKQ